MPLWTVYTRSGCGLCEEMLQDLMVELGSDQVSRVSVVDIGADTELVRKYGSRVPVLLADGEFVCAYRLDRDRLRVYLAEP